MALCLSGGWWRIHSWYVEGHCWRGYDTDWVCLWWDYWDVLWPQHRLLLRLGSSNNLLYKFSHSILVSNLTDIVFPFFDLIGVFLSLRPVSCTMMPTQAFTTTMMQKVDDTSFIPRLRCPPHNLLKNLAKTRALVTRRAESLRKGSRKPQTRIIRYVTPGCFSDS